MLNKKITVTAYDYLRLRGFANPDIFIDGNIYLKKKLAKLLDHADIVWPWWIPPDVLLRSRLCLGLSNAPHRT